MLTLKQAFSVAALQQSSRTQNQQCDSCPMQQLHRLCEKIEGQESWEGVVGDSIRKYVRAVEKEQVQSLHHTTQICACFPRLHPSKAKLELQRHVASLDSREQASIFESTVKSRPRTEQEENELVMSSLRGLYEERQKSHQHSRNGDLKQDQLSVNDMWRPEAGLFQVQYVGTESPLSPGASQSSTEEAPSDTQLSGSRLRLEQLKTRAKRSLTESLEGIWKGSRSRVQREGSEGADADSSSSSSTLNSSTREPSSLEDSLSSSLRPSSPLKSHNSTGDLKQLDTPTRDPQRLGFRRRASTFSHLPSSCSEDPSSPPVPQEPTAATKPKLVRHYSVSTDTPHQSNRSGSLSLGWRHGRVAASWLNI
ncbi:hypothetical protein JZ751_016451 [Albula glossodonta]|uniref:Uncharacterized protein n=1 Tax=Albula glossodonta TaxID=121402 RepID=A0A8T2NQD7_9TELE|nr:hypothetical protein JZ751_016451 [Albula glossodonta]